MKVGRKQVPQPVISENHPEHSSLHVDFSAGSAIVLAAALKRRDIRITDFGD
jgi:hypothetical protein